MEQVENMTELDQKNSADSNTMDPTESQTTNEKVIMPFAYGEDEHYYIEDLGILEKKPFYSFVKRAFDIVCSLGAMVLLAIPMLVIAVLIKCTSKGPVLYSQERLGLNGKPFKIVKFRTMVADAERRGVQWAQGDADDRITRIGSLLRKTRMDELPQLWGCLIGQLSLIGPRPEREIFYHKFEEHVHGFRERLKVKPGITGWAQVNGGYNLRPEEKVQYDIEYIKNRSVGMDIKILLMTVKVIFTHHGAK